MRLTAIALSLLGGILLPAKEPTGLNWVGLLPENTPLANLHLPGTHNSAALHEPLAGTTQCQTLSIAAQLQAGIRFLDIRCRHLDNRFHLYHGPVSQQQTFENLLATLSDFLRQNPGETLVVSIQETSQPKKNTRLFSETATFYFSQNKNLWHLQPDLPRLKDTRGKLILLRRFHSPQTLGIDATNWGHRGVHQSKQLLIQDQFKVTEAKEKWLPIQKLWQEKAQHPSLLALNFASGYSQNKLRIPSIPTISKPINKKLESYLTQEPSLPPSILILDFITPALSQKIYLINFKS